MRRRGVSEPHREGLCLAIARTELRAYPAAGLMALTLACRQQHRWLLRMP